MARNTSRNYFGIQVDQSTYRELKKNNKNNHFHFWSLPLSLIRKVQNHKKYINPKDKGEDWNKSHYISELEDSNILRYFSPSILLSIL